MWRDFARIALFGSYEQLPGADLVPNLLSPESPDEERFHAQWRLPGRLNDGLGERWVYHAVLCGRLANANHAICDHRLGMTWPSCRCPLRPALEVRSNEGIAQNEHREEPQGYQTRCFSSSIHASSTLRSRVSRS